MRVLARIGFTMAGMALAAPAAAWAGPPASNPGQQSQHSHRRGLFGGQRVCSECQRAKAQAHTSVPVPPAPPLPGPGVDGGSCAVCGNHTEVAHTAAGGTYGYNPGMAAHTPGHAVVGDEGVGFVTTDGGPVPIGMVAPQMASAPAPMGPNGPAAGPRDGSVMASGFSPSVNKPPGSNNPHVISHLLGFSEIGRERQEARSRRKGESHASIRYGEPNNPVTDVPAKVVYGR